jgi:8-oxo-dGTP pyrophosphatase MutT (NUDIX family)
LSPVGGFINDGETPFDAARREVVEELGMGSKHTAKLLKKKKPPEKGKQDDAFEIPTGDIVLDEFGLAQGTVPHDEQSQWRFLGRYRTAANRGGGFLYTYLLMDAVPVVETGGTAEYLRTGDEEEQKLVSMTLNEVTKALTNAEFQEVKWTATLSLALMHIQKQDIKTQ